MTSAAGWVFVVDDDASICRALARLLRSRGWQTATFGSAREFLAYHRPEAPSCLVLDVELPELSGLQLQTALMEHGVALPIVFITGHGDIPMSVKAIKSGAVDFLPKPFNDEDLLRAVGQALDADELARRDRCDHTIIAQRVVSLSPREREVLEQVVCGCMNKQIARRMGITEKTVKVHRGQVMRKMLARSLADLVRMTEKVGIPGSDGSRS